MVKQRIIVITLIKNSVMHKLIAKIFWFGLIRKNLLFDKIEIAAMLTITERVHIHDTEM